MHKRLWCRLLKWAGIALGCLALLMVLLITGVILVLSPDRLTPLASDISSRYLNGVAEARRVELTFWSSFPEVRVEVDSLVLISHALKSLPDNIRAEIPSSSDTLLKAAHFSGGINLPALTLGKVQLYDIVIDRPEANIVRVDSALANYNIVPPSDDTTKTVIPPISINRFVIAGDAPLRYVSLADSTDIRLSLQSTLIDSEQLPRYSVWFEAGGSGKLTPELKVPEVQLGLNGRIDWSQEEMYRLALHDMNISADSVGLTVDASVDFERQPVINSLKATGTNIKASSLISLLSSLSTEIPAELRDIDTDLTIGLKAELISPYILTDTLLPQVQAAFTLDCSRLNYDRLRLLGLNADAEVMFDGQNPDNSVVTINDLSVKGRSIAFAVNGVITRPMTDPMIDGVFDGSFNFGTLPAKFLHRLPFIASGKLTGHTTVKMRMSDLHPHRFHKIKAEGNLTLTDMTFAMRDSSTLASTPRARLDFGTSTSHTAGDVRIDSLLRVTITSDTLFFYGQGMRLEGKDIDLRAASRNTAASADTSKINPIGFALRAANVTLRSDSDSMRVVFRDAHARATLQRYEGHDRAPLLNIDVNAGRLRYVDPVSRISLSNVHGDMAIHPRGTGHRPRRVRNDSARVRSLIIDDKNGRENIDFDIDKSFLSLLRRWQAHGNIAATRGRLLTPYFPVRNILRNVDVEFSTDSVVLRNLSYRMGKSDFLINGTISNIARALTSRRGSPLKVDFTIKSDTLDINNITSALMAGAAYSKKVEARGREYIADSEDDDAMQHTINRHASDTARAAFIVPSNIDAQLKLEAQNVLFADIWFQRMKGNIAVHDGAVHLDRLAGYTPMGAMDLTALYSAPIPTDLRFAAGIVVRELQIHQFLRMLPELDSILPLLNEVSGIITADAAMSTELDSMMNIKFHTLNMVLKLEGDSLALIDNHTFRTISKWLMFKHKDRNVIDHMQVELMVKDSRLNLFPFVFDLDRYRIGVSGSNTLNMDLDYRIAVLKSPLPFKFGITIKGRPGHLKFGLGKARFDENAVTSRRELTDTARINLIEEIAKVFKFGVKNGHHTKLMLEAPKISASEFSVADTLTHADSLIFIQGGAIEGPAAPPFPFGDNAEQKKSKKKRKK